MWEYEHTAVTDAPAELLWQRWSDVTGWPEWNAGIERIEIDGPFAAGTRFRMTPPGDEAIAMTITRVEPGVEFVDEMDGGDFVVRTMHRLEDIGDGRTRIRYRTEIDGPAAGSVGPEIGPAITADFPEVVAALIDAAKRRHTLG
jgi:uncharacterized protein YndB with AHSA1/START domain